MNSYGRYLAVLENKPCDILPRLPILMGFAANYIGADYGQFASDYKVLVEANRRCVEDFKFDQVSVISDPYRETTGFGGKVEFVKDGVPRLISSPLENSKDLTKLQKPNPHLSVRLKDRIEAVKALADLYEGQYSILGWIEGPAAEAADLRGVMNFLFDIIDDPEFCQKLMSRCVEVGMDFALAQIKAGADTIGIGDAIVSQISPAVYQELIFPWQKQLITRIQKAGAFVRLHICGDITKHLPVISQLGVDILDLDWPVNIAYARSVVGDETVLVANPNPVEDIQNGSPEQIKKQVATLYKQVGNPFMVGAGCEIPVATPRENLLALCEPVGYK